MANEKLLSETRRDIIIALADNNMQISATARQVHMSRTALVNNLIRIEEITEKNPLDFYDLISLVVWVRKERCGSAILARICEKGDRNDIS